VRGEDVEPLLQVLIQPVTDISVHRSSQDEFADSPALTAKQVEWFMQHYLPAGTDVTDPRVSPLRAESLEGLPRAIVTLGGFDPLHDDGHDYAAALLESGVPTQVIREAGNVHGYLSFTALSPSSRAATERLVSAVSTSLNERSGLTSDLTIGR
jgi:acetyl esterase